MDSVVADVDVLGARLCYRVGCHEYGPLIITANWDSLQPIAKLTEQTSNPGNLVSAIAQSHVFSLSGQVRYVGDRSLAIETYIYMPATRGK